MEKHSEVIMRIYSWVVSLTRFPHFLLSEYQKHIMMDVYY